MNTLRLFPFFGRILLGTVWSSLLLILSLRLAVDRFNDPGAGAYVIWLAIAGIAAGNFVFMYVVADRLCRVKERWPVDLVEFATLVVFGFSTVITIVLWLTGDGA